MYGILSCVFFSTCICYFAYYSPVGRGKKNKKNKKEEEKKKSPEFTHYYVAQTKFYKKLICTN